MWSVLARLRIDGCGWGWVLGLLACVSGTPMAWGETDPANALTGNPRAQAYPVTVGQSRALLPPAILVELENPSKAAILRHDVRADLDPSTGRLEARDVITVVHQPDVAGSKAFPLLLWKGLELREVRGFPGFPTPSPEELVPSHRGDTFAIEVSEREGLRPRSFWRRPPYDALSGYEKARQIDLTMGEATLERFGGVWPETLRIELVYDGVIADSLTPPSAAYARSFETTPGLICEDGVFLASSSFWVPYRPDEVFTFSLETHLPTGWRSVTQGGLARSFEAEGRHADVWHCPHPMEEIYLVAGPWTLRELDHGGVKAQTFTYADTDSSLYNRYLRGTARYLDLYEGLFGPYPFAKFALVENFWQTGYGMPSFTLLGDRVIRLPFILDTSYGHEVLHNWWGNGVFVQRNSGNWCEGLTTYGADYLYKEREGAAQAREYRLNALKSYRDYVSAGEDRPLRTFTERHDLASQAIGYSKSMMVIHEMRREAGEAAFWTGLRDFYREHLWKRASWGDLFESVASVGGGASNFDAAAFREQWIDRAGAPVLAVDGLKLAPAQGATGAGDHEGWMVSFELVQEPSTEDAEPFRVLVPLRAKGEAGEVADWSVWLDGERLPVVRQLDFAPRWLEVDPDFEVMRSLHRSEIPASLSQTLGADTVVVVIADGLSGDVAEAYAELATEWDQGQALAILKEADLPADWAPETAVWYLGAGPRARASMEAHGSMRADGDGWMAEEEPVSAAWSWVAAGGDAQPWTIIRAAGAEMVPVIGAKVPHYGRYSYLAFDGPKNVAKGTWVHTASPLKLELAAIGP